MELGLSGKSAILCRASSGLGLGVATTLAAEGPRGTPPARPPFVDPPGDLTLGCRVCEGRPHLRLFHHARLKKPAAPRELSGAPPDRGGDRHDDRKE